MSRDTLDRLRFRLENVRHDAQGGDTAQELEIALAELQAMWDEVEAQADALTRERARYSALFDLAPYACFITDWHGIVRESNRAAHELFGMPGPQLAGRPMTLLLADGDRPALRALLARAAASPAPLEPWNAFVKTPAEPRMACELRVRAVPGLSRLPASLAWFIRRLD